MPNLNQVFKFIASPAGTVDSVATVATDDGRQVPRLKTQSKLTIYQRMASREVSHPSILQGFLIVGVEVSCRINSSGACIVG